MTELKFVTQVYILYPWVLRRKPLRYHINSCHWRLSFSSYGRSSEHDCSLPWEIVRRIFIGQISKPYKQINCRRVLSETWLSEHAGFFYIWATSFFFPNAEHLITCRFDFVCLLLFCMLAKYKRATLTCSPDSPRESKLLLFMIMVLTFLLWETT